MIGTARLARKQGVLRQTQSELSELSQGGHLPSNYSFSVEKNETILYSMSISVQKIEPCLFPLNNYSNKALLDSFQRS